MSDKNVVRYAFFAVFGLFILLLTVTSMLSVPLRTRASANSVILTIKLQGTYKPSSQIKARVDFYDGAQKATSEAEVVFTSSDNLFTGTIGMKPGFDFSKFYALFIKPDKFLGRVFCSSSINGASCTTPQMVFSSAGSVIDLSGTAFLSGDIAPTNGKVDAQDMSLIMKNLGKTDTSTTDINADGITDVVDYSLALYSLSRNAADDPVNLQTGSPTPSPAASPTTAPTSTTAPIPTSLPAATATPTPTSVPTATATPTPTTAPTNTPVPVSGKCTAIPPSLAGLMGCSTDPYTVNDGQTTACTSCAGTTAKATCTCPTGTCTCNIPASQPPLTVNCTNGGTLVIQLCQ